MLFAATAVGQTTVTFVAGTDKGSYTDNSHAGDNGSDKVTKDGVTILGTKGTTANNSSAIFGATNQYRIYAGGTLVVSSTVGNIVKIETTHSNNNSNGPSHLSTSSGGTYSTNNTVGTWVSGSAELSSVTFACDAQVRITKIVVTIESGKSDPLLAFPESSYTIQFLNTGSFAAVSGSNPASTGAISYEYTTLPDGTTAVYNETTKNFDVTAGETEGSFTLTATIAETDDHAAGTATTTIHIIDTRKDPDLKWSSNTASAVIDESFTAPTLSHKSDATPTFESSNTSVATIDASGNVTILAAGTTTITASLARTDTYKAATASYTLTVTDPAAVTSDGKYAMVYDASSLRAGEEIIIVNYANKVAMASDQGTSANNRGKVDVTITNNVVEAPEGVLKITLEGSASGWYLKTDLGYLSKASGNNNGMPIVSTQTDLAKATIAISDVGAATIKMGGSSYTIRYNSGNNPPIFSCYSSGQNGVQIYRKCKTIPETRALENNAYSTMLLENAVVLNSYLDGTDCHVYVREGKKANQAIEVVIPNQTAVPSWAKKGQIVNGYVEGQRQTTADGSPVDRLYYTMANNSSASGGDLSPVELSSTDNIGDYSCNYVKLLEQDVTAGIKIGGMTLNDVFDVASKWTDPYVGASVDVWGIAYLTSDTEIRPINLSGSNATSVSPYVYVFNEMKAMAQPTEKYEGVPARLIRKFYTGWNTMRLPFHVETNRFKAVFGDDYVMGTFGGLSKDESLNALMMNFNTSATTPGNNMSVLLQLSRDVENPEFDKVTIDPLRDADVTKSITLDGQTYTVTFRGILEPTQIEANDGTKLFLGSSGNELVYASVTNKLRATRCYFDLSFNFLDHEASTAFFAVDGEELTAIDGIPVARPAQDAPVYNLQGQHMGRSLQHLPKGIYIVSGRKMVVK